MGCANVTTKVKERDTNDSIEILYDNMQILKSNHIKMTSHLVRIFQKRKSPMQVIYEVIPELEQTIN